MLMILIVVLCVSECTVSADSVLYTYTNRHPSAVMIIHNSHQPDVRCTGNLLSSWWVLTAARCVFDRTGIRIDTKYIQVRANKYSSKKTSRLRNSLFIVPYIRGPIFYSTVIKTSCCFRFLVFWVFFGQSRLNH